MRRTSSRELPRVRRRWEGAGGKHGAVSTLCWMDWEWEISREPSIHYSTYNSFLNYPFTSPERFISGLLPAERGRDPEEHCISHRAVVSCSLALWTTCLRVRVWVQRAGAKRHGAGSGFFLQHQHSCIGCGRNGSQQFLQCKDLGCPCSWLLLILLLESAALRGLQPHFYWKSFAVLKPFSLWLGYCSHKSSYWPLGNSLMFVL